MLNLHLWRSASTINNTTAATASANRPGTLAQVKSGQHATITGFDTLSQQCRMHLQAYGLLPGRKVFVMAQRPVTIVLIEQTELAFENGIAQQIFVE